MPNYETHADLTRLTLANTSTRNPNIWLKNIDTSAICINLPNYPYFYPNCALISPLHVIGVSHNTTSCADIGGYGTSVRFITMNNEPIDRVVTYFQKVPDVDLAVGILDQEIPSSIKIAKVLPDNWELYFKEVASNPNLYEVTNLSTIRNRISAIYANQFKFISPHDWIGLWKFHGAMGCFGGPDTDNVLAFFTRPLNATINELYFDIVSGDSGSGAFLIINKELVLMSCTTQATGGGGPFLPFYRDRINNVMLAQGGGYTLTDVDLSIGGDIAIEDVTTSPQIPQQIQKKPIESLL